MKPDVLLLTNPEGLSFDRFDFDFFCFLPGAILKFQSVYRVSALAQASPFQTSCHRNELPGTLEGHPRARRQQAGARVNLVQGEEISAYPNDFTDQIICRCRCNARVTPSSTIGDCFRASSQWHRQEDNNWWFSHVTQVSLIITQMKNKIAYHSINWVKKLTDRRIVINKFGNERYSQLELFGRRYHWKL